MTNSGALPVEIANKSGSEFEINSEALPEIKAAVDAARKLLRFSS
jgi:hypothetical protein